ncbi:unnamed protein product [Rotaria sordida]|uniref:G-protein coupled receptors family 1 profile domain-containing protein n=1 Tax=Rotaria sordida TaxID=392033 RepID=A0A819L8Y7_9BILA|nr:unnamed protein product [Rotaria sordida]CAF3956912.1 unnamed protein product [Rotaria sordida]
MFNISLNTSSNEDLISIAISFTIMTIVLACLTIILNSVILFRLIYYGKLRKRSSKSTSRRIGLLHSMNTYIHIIGCTTTFLIMSIRTLFGDLYLYNKEEMSPSWHCRLLNYLTSMFPAGIYGSCFLQALFRFWRIIKPHQHLYRKFSFHIRLIHLHWILIIILSIPVWFRSVYLLSENFCLNHFSDTWSSVYISVTSAIIPVFGISIVYLKIVLYMKHNWQSRKRWRRMKRDAATIRRIILLVIVLLNTSSAAIILWLLMYIQKHMHPLSYRLLCFMVEIGMLACSITLLTVSPQLRRALQSTNHYRNINIGIIN